MSEICAMHVALLVFMVNEIYGANRYCNQLININKKLWPISILMCPYTRGTENVLLWILHYPCRAYSYIYCINQQMHLMKYYNKIQIIKYNSRYLSRTVFYHLYFTDVLRRSARKSRMERIKNEHIKEIMGVKGKPDILDIIQKKRLQKATLKECQRREYQN